MPTWRKEALSDKLQKPNEQRGRHDAPPEDGAAEPAPGSRDIGVADELQGRLSRAPVGSRLGMVLGKSTWPLVSGDGLTV